MPFVPLYLRIKELVHAELLEGNGAAAGSRLPTERELQARYRVSRPTISKALASLAAEGHISKAQGRGCFVLSPRPADVDPLSAPPRRIGYVAPIVRETLVQRSFRGIERAAHRRSYRVLIGNAGNSVERERATVLELLASGAQGLVIYPVPRRAYEVDGDYLRTEDLGVPVVLIDTCWPDQGHTQVVFDNRRLAYDMTEHLLGRGHRRIGLLSYTDDIRHATLAARLGGHRDALHDHGVAFDPTLIRRFTPYQERAEFPAILDDWLRRSEPPTAIIATEDVAAMELIEQLMDRRVAVPEEVRVVGFDNQDAARRFRPAFTTTNPDFERMGETACGLLLDAMENGEPGPRTYVLSVPILIRRAHEVQEPHVMTIAPAARPLEVGAGAKPC